MGSCHGTYCKFMIGKDQLSSQKVLQSVKEEKLRVLKKLLESPFLQDHRTGFEFHDLFVILKKNNSRYFSNTLVETLSVQVTHRNVGESLL